MKIEINKSEDRLLVGGEEFWLTAELEAEVLASSLSDARLSDLPRGVSVSLCDRVIGSRDLYRRHPYCTLQHTREDEFVGHGETAFLGETEFLDDWGAVEPDARQKYFREAINAAKLALAPLAEDGRLIESRESVSEDIAYLEYSVLLYDQTILEAEAFMAAIEARIPEGLDRPLLFLCHASEDTVFAERLVRELNRRALHAWFDEYEILVGDSIVEKVNAGLSRAQYLIAVLSQRSVRKPWILRELNSSLMRQLTEGGITVLPVLLETCDIPPLLKDIKYADFRGSFERGCAELFAAIRSGRPTSGHHIARRRC